MKKMRKILSALLAMSMVFTLLAVSASAAGPDVHPVRVQALTQEETDAIFNTRGAAITSTTFLPRNNLQGTNGNACAPFKADTTSVSFVIKQAPGAVTYNVQLYMGPIGNGYRVAQYDKELPINNGAAFYDLIIGQSYYFMVSSNDVANGGCTATYTYQTF